MERRDARSPAHTSKARGDVGEKTTSRFRSSNSCVFVKIEQAVLFEFCLMTTERMNYFASLFNTLNIDISRILNT